MSEAHEKKIAELEQELVVAGEMLAQILNVTGPVKIARGVEIKPGAHIEVNFDPNGEYAMVELMNNEQ